MKKLTLSLFALVLSANAFAVYDPSWERPFLTANMNIVEVSYGFENMKEVQVTLSQRDDADQATSIRIDYTIFDEDSELGIQPLRETSVLMIESISQDECGSTVYSAFKGDEMGAREHLTLIDHSTRICEDRPMGRWYAYYRVGFGWCGTMDDVAEFYGNPEGVMTIQNNN